MTDKAEFERLLDVYGFRCGRFGQDLSTHARAQVVSAFAALASAPVAPLSAAAQASQNGCRCVRFGKGNPHWPCPLHPSAPVAGEAIYQTRRMGDGGCNWEDVTQQQYEAAVTSPARRWERRIVYAAPQAGEAVRDAALYLLREARALLPAFATAEAIGAWSEKVRKFGAGDVIDVPPQADKDGGQQHEGDVVLPPYPSIGFKDPAHGYRLMHQWGVKAVLADRQQDAIAWESTTPAYIKFITDSRYRKFSPAVRKWYRPYRCASCAALSATQTEQGERDA